VTSQSTLRLTERWNSKNETLKEIIREKEKKGEKHRAKKTKVKIIKKTIDIFYV